MVRRGELINRFTDRDGIDGGQVVKLVEEAFGRSLKDGWWAGLELDAAYLSESMRAGAIVTRVGDIDYLDKFAILEDARGEGLARTVWAHLVTDHPVLYWRSRTDNGFNSFYAEEADGSVKRGPWTVFWKGESEFARIAPRVEEIAALPPSFVGDDDE
jgi:acetylglutamate kinase